MRKDTAFYGFLRRIYWWYHGKWEKRVIEKMLREKRKMLLSPPGKKAYMIGTPTHENLGDSAIVLAQRAFLEKNGLAPERIHEITEEDYRAWWDRIRKWIPKSALIAQLGGGHMGNQWPEEERLHRKQVEAFPKNPNIIFPQTLYYLPDEQGRTEAQASVPIYNGKQKLTMAAREKKSYQTMQELYPDTRILLTPDIVLSADMEIFGAKPQKRDGVRLCFRNDSERIMKAETQAAIRALLERKGLSWQLTDMYAEGRVDPGERKERVRQKMEELASSRLVITDRLHGMIFCALTGTPCIVFSNNNPKVRGTYEWISYLPYIRFLQSAEEMESILPELLEMENCKFDNTPLKPYFENLAEVVREYACNECDRPGL